MKLQDTLPQGVTVDGRFYRLDFDFRNVLRMMEVMGRNDLMPEAREYLYNLFLSEFGIHANTVLKRERQLTGEIDMQIEKPVFNINSMLQAREESAKRLSKTFGAEISVRINPKYMYVEEQTDGSENEVTTDDNTTPDTQTDDKNTGDDAGETNDSNQLSD